MWLSVVAAFAFGTLLGLGAFTTYSWVTQFESPRTYLRYPVDYADVFRGTLRAYLTLSLSAAVGSAVALSAVAGAVGWILTRRAGPRWTERLRKT